MLQSNFLEQNKNKVIFISGTALTLSILMFRDTPEKIGKRIIKTAKKYVGQREISNNKGFWDKNFEKKMKSAGWYAGAQWCAYFVRMIVLEALKNDYYRSFVLRKQLSKYGSALGTWHNFNKHNGFWDILQSPVPGAIAVWKKPNSENSNYIYGRGHIEIVTKVNENGFYSIGGNQGDAVSFAFRNSRSFSGMVLQGFIKIK